MFFYGPDPYKYGIFCDLGFGFDNDYANPIIYSWHKYSKKEMIKIIKNYCGIIYLFVINDNSYDWDDFAYDVANLIVTHEEDFFYLPLEYNIEINLQCDKHAYKVKPIRCGCEEEYDEGSDDDEM